MFPIFFLNNLIYFAEKNTNSNSFYWGSPVFELFFHKQTHKKLIILYNYNFNFLIETKKHLFGVKNLLFDNVYIEK